MDWAASQGAPEWAQQLAQQLGVYIVLFGAGVAAAAAARKPSATDASWQAAIVRAFAFGTAGSADANDGATTKSAEPGSDTTGRSPVLGTYAFCAMGLLASYLSWGVLQEKIMSHEYAGGKLESSTFLVFCNRAVAVAVAFALVRRSGPSGLRAPLVKFSYVSLSNVLSSWCQLESLKYVDFPTQVLAKSSKLIPVMIVGTVLVGKRYKAYEYVVAILIGVGAGVFTLAQRGSKSGSTALEPSLAGYALLALYLIFDSYTSQWQGHLFSTYGCSSYEMMFGVNLFSAFFTLVALLQTGELATSVAFLASNMDCALHVALFSLAGVVGQTFIFHTIKSLGPLAFSTIMTTRQVLSITLSCLLFGHAVGKEGVAGAALVFGAVGYQIFRTSVGPRRGELKGGKEA